MDLASEMAAAALPEAATGQRDLLWPAAQERLAFWGTGAAANQIRIIQKR